MDNSAVSVTFSIAPATSVWYSTQEMKHTAAKSTDTVSSKTPFTAGVIGFTFLDTTWRIAVPVILCTAIGIFADLRLGTKPWLTLLAVVVGFVTAGWLVKKQIEAAEREERKKK